MKAYRSSCSRRGLFISTALCSALWSGLASAQTEAGGGGSNIGLDSLEEVVVTATRQTDTVNRVPLSITAETQRTLDQKGIKTVQDLQANVPAVIITQSLGSGVANVAIRGIVQGSDGAATTGFYLDDTPIQKRNVGGGVATANGTPLPPLFDLERVEVLRGPQGTLFGGGSEGGTIRYITPAPSLTRYSALVRVEGSKVRNGDENYEGGVAVGGPIIADKLGFRASYYHRHTAGFIDLVDPYTSRQTAKNVNEGNIDVFRGALTWAVTDRARVTFSYLSSRDETKDNSSAFTLPTSQALVVPATCYNTTNIASLPVGAAARTNPTPVGRGAACAGLMAAGAATYTQPGGTFGPYALRDYQRLDLQGLTPTATNLQIAALTIDYDFDNMSMKSITSYIDDQNKSINSGTSQWGRTAYNATFGSITIPSGLNLLSGYPTVAAGNENWFNLSGRYGLTQEVRFSSKGDARPLSWVAGVFYANLRGKHQYDNRYDNDTLARYLYGITTEQRYGENSIVPGQRDNFGGKRQFLKDVEIAAFAEGNYWITEKLRVTAGLRVSRVSFDYNQSFYGPFAGFGVPTLANGGVNGGSVTESPVTPKFGVQYQITNNDMVYVTAAKGFRAGGINSYITRAICGPALDQYQATERDLPLTYKSDSVWSYEAGSKLRLFNRLQLNGAVYQIDWKDPQVTLSPGFNCGLASTYNGTAARSRGFEIEAQAKLWWGFSANANMGYNNTKYTEGSTFTFPSGRALVTTLAGQKFALPPYTISVGLRYDFRVGDMDAYARGDWRYTRKYETVPFGTASWNPDSNFNPSTDRTNVRLGIQRGGLDANFFVNNLFNLDKGNIGGGRSGCTLPANGGTQACTVFANYNPFRNTSWGRPREIGIQLNYRQ